MHRFLRNLAKFKAATVIWLLTIAFVAWAPAFGQTPGRPWLDPLHAPPLPDQAPPAIAVTSQTPTISNFGGPYQSLFCGKGWQILSFPVGRLDAIQGLPRQLIAKGPNGVRYIDPVNHPEAVEPGSAYITYFDEPTTITYTGPTNNGYYRNTRLYAGWNLVGCPSDKPIPLANVTLTRPGGTTARPNEVMDSSTTPGSAWLFSTAYAFNQGKWHKGTIGQAALSSFNPGQVLVVFCWSEISINWNIVPPSSGVPVLGSVSPAKVAPGQAVVLKGRYFGEPGHGVVSITGLPIQPEYITFWEPGTVKFRMPPGCKSGKVHIMVDRFPSNPMPIQILPSTSQVNGASDDLRTGALVGEVVDNNGYPLANAQIALDDGQQTVSNIKGMFSVPELPPHTSQVYITLPGYKSAKGTVHIKPGEVRTLKVSLSPTKSEDVGARSQEASGTFSVVAEAFSVGTHDKRFWVYKLEVWEYGNYAKRWSKTWWDDLGDSRYELSCPEASVGRSYCVVVTWRNADGNERSRRWTPEFQNDGQTFHYYNPL